MNSKLVTLLMYEINTDQDQIDDVEDTWRYSQKFDFIHIRSLGGSIASWSVARFTYGY